MFTNDNPLNASDALGLRVQETGTASCGVQDNSANLQVLACNGQTANGRSAVGVTVSLPTTEFSVGVGTVLLTQTLTIGGSSSIVVGDGTVTVSNGGGSATFSSDGSITGSLSPPGVPSISLSNAGLTISSSTTTHLGNAKVQVDTTATFYPDTGPPPSAGTYQAVGGSVALGAIIYFGAKPFCVLLAWLAPACVATV
jgi:hypothetical protein